MDFKNYLQNQAQLVNNQLESIFSFWQKQIESTIPQLLPLLDLNIDASLGGKRLRAGLVRLGYEMAGGEANKDILTVAAAFEIFQTAILIHDDIIDNSLTRRGKKTVYQALGGDHYGVSQAICLADLGFFQAVQLITQTSFPDELKTKAVHSFTQIMIETTLGEMLDIEVTRPQVKKDQTTIRQIFELKTAKYTVVGPLQLGAVLARSGQALLDQIQDFGLSLGVAYQVQDDILGVFGVEAELGKSVTSDTEEGKATLLYVYALENANQSQKQILDQFYGKGQITLNQLEQIKQVFVQTGALKYCEEYAGGLVNQSKQVINKMQLNSKYSILLSQMADFLVSRKR